MGKLQELLAERPYLLADGATGTVLMARGLQQGDPPEGWNIERGDDIRAMHREYIEAGSDIILTNSFGGSSFRLKLHRLENRVRELNRAAAELARAEADKATRPVIVAGDIGPSGEILEPLGSLTLEEARAGFKEQMQALVEGGVDCIWIETMSALNELEAAIGAAQELAQDANKDIDVVVTLTFDTNGRTMMGVSPEEAMDWLGQFPLTAVGGNCGNGVEELQIVVQKLYNYNQNLPIVAKSNAGIPEFVDGAIRYSAGEEEMAAYAVTVANMGARVIGGCCGSSPAMIKAMAEALANTSLQSPQVTATPVSAQTPANDQRRRRGSRRARGTSS